MSYSLDRNRNDGGIMIFVKEDMPSKILKIHNSSNCSKYLFVENQDGFCLGLSTHLHKLTTFLAVLIKLLMLTVTMKIFNRQEILMQKKMSLA